MAQLESLHPVLQALVATLFTWAITALGAAAIFLVQKPSRRLLDAMLGFAAGVMIAASCWSLLIPAIQIAASQGRIAWLPAAIGFLLGGTVLRIVDRFLPHLHPGTPQAEPEGLPTRWRRTLLMVIAITLHNFPEGLAVGVAYGAAAVKDAGYSLAGAVALTIGIGLQNMPEGMAVSFPLHRAGLSRARSFWYGQLSGMVEPVAGVLGAVSLMLFRPALPYALGFAAGAMIFVVVEDAVPESQSAGNYDAATLGAMLGFVVMMILDTALG